MANGIGIQSSQLTRLRITETVFWTNKVKRRIGGPGSATAVSKAASGSSVNGTSEIVNLGPQRGIVWV